MERPGESYEALDGKKTTVFVGRALLGCLQLPTGQSRQAILVLDKRCKALTKVLPTEPSANCTEVF